MQIHLDASERQLCEAFANDCASNEQAIEFGEYDTQPRCKEEIRRDTLIGKIAEIAFARFLKEQFSVLTELDFDTYPRGKWDRQDAIINGWRIDMKGVRSGGRWLLLEQNKRDFRRKENATPHLLMAASVGWDRTTDCPDWTVIPVGCISYPHLNPRRGISKILRKGDYLPGTKTKLQADNIGVPFSSLNDDWEFIIRYILSHDPPLLDTSWEENL